MNPTVEHPDVARVASELTALCFRAGVSADDAGDWAARAVCAVCARELRELYPTADPDWPCLVNAWLLARCQDVVAVVSEDRVIFPRIVVGRLPRTLVKRAGGRVFATLDLSPAVRAAVARYDRRKGAA